MLSMQLSRLRDVGGSGIPVVHEDIERHLGPFTKPRCGVGLVPTMKHQSLEDFLLGLVRGPLCRLCGLLLGDLRQGSEMVRNDEPNPVLHRKPLHRPGVSLVAQVLPALSNITRDSLPPRQGHVAGADLLLLVLVQPKLDGHPLGQRDRLASENFFSAHLGFFNPRNWRIKSHVPETLLGVVELDSPAVSVPPVAHRLPLLLQLTIQRDRLTPRQGHACSADDRR
mmetsp:Transcript_98208/g.262370  ORF Transcript_98208/g.262370 Transcript_98208/m.262370 type:complete len:225 (+) Transcript_98208:254-928(+)